jgi:4-hydroxy-tetrahydrodipicolinate reductase
MNILLLGYGKMGKAIEKIAEERGHHIIGRIDDPSQPRDEFVTDNTDVAIEFSQPESAVDNIKWCLDRDIPVVCGTTGWLDHWDEIVKLCQLKNGSFFYASNYSIGMNIFMALNRYLGDIMEHFPAYDIGIQEIHHTEKKDAPSGTAITLAKDLISRISRKKGWNIDNQDTSEQLHIQSIREPDVPGTHSIVYSSDEDEIELKHTALTRKGFARGAVLVAEWLPGKKGPLGMTDFLDF